MGKQREVVDGTESKAVVVYELPKMEEGIDADFLASNDLTELEDGIRYIERASKSLAVVQGIAILKAEELWEQSGLSSITAYRKEANTRYGMSRAAVSQRRKMAYAWLDNIKLLRRLDLTDKSTHLLYLDDALKRYDKQEVLAAFRTMSSRDFKEFATGGGKVAKSDLPEVSLSIADGEIRLDGTPFLSFEEEIPEEERDFIGRLLQKAYRARAGSLLPHVVAVYDEGEARAVDNFLKKLRAGK